MKLNRPYLKKISKTMKAILSVTVLLILISPVGASANIYYLGVVCSEADAAAILNDITFVPGTDDCTNCAKGNISYGSSVYIQYFADHGVTICDGCMASEFKEARVYSADYDTMAKVIYVHDNDGTYNGEEYNFYCANQDPCIDHGGDDDADGICDDNDPCDGPNDNMVWKTVAQQFDSQGNICKRTVRIDCAGDGSVIQEKTIIYSESPDCSNGEVAIAPNDAPYDKDSTDWAVGEEGEGEMYSPAPEDYVYRGEWAQQEGIPSSPADGIEGGIGTGDVDPADGDTGLLEAIVDNTAGSNSNDQIIADYLKALNQMGSENGKTMERILEGVEEGFGLDGDGQGGSGGDDQGVGDAYQAELDAAIAEGESEFNADLEVPEEYQEKTLWSEMIDNILTSSPLAGWFAGIQLQATGNPVVSCDVFGKNIVFDLSRFDASFVLWGAIMELIVLWNCVLIVFRRR